MSTAAKRQILVPHDFTELSDYALKHAVLIAKITERDLALLHIVHDLKDERPASQKLKEISENLLNKYGIQSRTIVRPGKVSRDIKVVAETIDAFIVVMKVKKPEGKEKILGSRSIKVMVGSKIPYFIVQAPPTRMALRRVVFPIDFRKENKEKLVVISFLSKYYTSKVFLVKPNAHDYKIRNNIEFAKRFLEGKNIDYEIVSTKSHYNIIQDTLDYAREIHAELIIIMLSRNITAAKMLFGIREQKFIINDYKIPVMVVNPRADLTKFGSFY
jgi:nucleotide-binding universal stress UspA family protein